MFLYRNICHGHRGWSSWPRGVLRPLSHPLDPLLVYADEPRPFFLSHNPVLRATKLVSRHLCLDNSSVPSLRYNEPFIPPWRAAAGRGALTFLPLTWPSTVVVPRTCRDDSVISCRSALPLGPSCAVQRRFCAPQSFCRSGMLLLLL